MAEYFFNTKTQKTEPLEPIDDTPNFSVEDWEKFVEWHKNLNDNGTGVNQECYTNGFFKEIFDKQVMKHARYNHFGSGKWTGGEIGVGDFIFSERIFSRNVYCHFRFIARSGWKNQLELCAVGEIDEVSYRKLCKA
ncbi:MAG: hypothetical protein FWG64_02750 [Firmicutes bacterium]|nr:hypothetical protein [Bacillota bacterium]